jgi:uncharacterized protein YcnI
MPIGSLPRKGLPTRRTRHAGRARRTRRLVATGSLTLAVLILAPLAEAEAHVTVHADTTTAGAESAELTFRVPTESAKASTVKVELKLPTAHPLADVLAQPIAGWSVQVTNGPLPAPVVIDGTTFTEAPVSVTWTVQTPSAAVKPGEYQDFSISGGPLPDSGTVSFAAVQTYSDGSIVTWDQPQAPGQAEPEHPAPHFEITPVLASTPAVTADSPDHATRWLAAGALALSAVAVVISVVGVPRRRSVTS